MLNDEPLPAELRAATKDYESVRALDRVDLALAPGRLTSLLGPNGAGKTTAIRLLLGSAKATSGTATLFGLPAASRAAHRRVGAMLQVGKVPETLSAREHLELFRSYYPAPRPMDDLLDVAGISTIADRRFGALSGGQKQRVLFAIALCGNPDLLFLDEPTVGLDVEARRLVWDAIRRMVGEGRTVLLTTHNLEEADALSDRVVVLHRGRVTADGTPAEVKRRVAGRRVRCVTRIPEAEVRGWPHVLSAATDGGALVIVTSDAERTARALLAADSALSGLEVGGIDLEEAFVALTSEGGRA